MMVLDNLRVSFPRVLSYPNQRLGSRWVPIPATAHARSSCAPSSGIPLHWVSFSPLGQGTVLRGRGEMPAPLVLWYPSSNGSPPIGLLLPISLRSLTYLL